MALDNDDAFCVYICIYFCDVTVYERNNAMCPQEQDIKTF